METSPSPPEESAPSGPVVAERRRAVSSEDALLDSPRPRRPRRPFGALLWWALFLLFAFHFYNRYVETARAVPRHGKDLYKIERIGVNVEERETILGNVLAIGGRLFGIGSYEGDFFKDGWKGYDFNGLNMTVCILARSGGRQAIYPDQEPKALVWFQEWSAEVGREYSEGGDLNFVSNGAYIYPPITAVLLVPWAGRGPDGLFDLWIRFSRVLVVVLWGLCIWAAWRAYGRTDPIDWVVVAAMIVFNYPVVWGLVEYSNASILMAVLTTAGMVLLLRPWEWQTGAMVGLVILWVYAAHSDADTLLTLAALLVATGLAGAGLLLSLRGRLIPAGLAAVLSAAVFLHAVFHYRAIPNVISMAVLFVLLLGGMAMVFRGSIGATAAFFGAALFFVLITRGGMGFGNGLLLGLVCGAVLFFVVRTQDWLFGLVFALAIQLKLSPIIFLPWLLMRRRIRPLAATVVFSVVWLLIALYGVGLDDHIRFVKSIVPWVARGEVYWPNQSLNGLIRRLLEPGKSILQLTMEAAPAGVALATRAASVGTILLAYVLLWFFRRRCPTAHRVALEYSLLLVAGVAASPTSWEHHYTGLLVVWVLLYAALRYHLPGWRRWVGLGLFCVGWTLNARFFPVWEFPQRVPQLISEWKIGFLAPYAGTLGRVLVSHRVFSLGIAVALILMAHAPTPAERQAEREVAQPDFIDWDVTRTPVGHREP